MATNSEIEELEFRLISLIGKFAGLFDWVAKLSTDDLTLHLLEAHSQLEKNQPLAPPQQFIQSARKIPTGDWKTLMADLEYYQHSLEMTPDGDLSNLELETLALGLLWETVLITEFQHRQIEA